MIKLRTIFTSLSMLTILSTITINTVACTTWINSSYMSDDVLENLGFISLDSQGGGRYKVVAQVSEDVIFTDQYEDVTANWDFTQIESVSLANLINKSNNLGWTGDIDNFLQEKLHFRLNPKKEFNLTELNKYHLKVLSNPIVKINGNVKYGVSEQDLIVQWWKSSRNGPVFLKNAKFNLNIIESNISAPSWSSLGNNWFDQDKLAVIISSADTNDLDIVALNDAFTDKAKAMLYAYSNLLHVQEFKIDRAVKEYKRDSWGRYYWVIDFSLKSNVVSYQMEVSV